jgi:hypothetical protein
VGEGTTGRLHLDVAGEGTGRLHFDVDGDGEGTGRLHFDVDVEGDVEGDGVGTLQRLVALTFLDVDGLGLGLWHLVFGTSGTGSLQY